MRENNKQWMSEALSEAWKQHGHQQSLVFPKSRSPVDSWPQAGWESGTAAKIKGWFWHKWQKYNNMKKITQDSPKHRPLVSKSRTPKSPPPLWTIAINFLTA